MNGDFNLIWIVLLLPVVGFLIQAFLGKRLAQTAGKRVVGALAVIPILAAFAVALVITQKLAGMDPASRSAVVTGFPWIDTANLKIPFELIIDPLSMTMVLIITGIGGLIHLYATGYMAEEKDYARFFTYLNLFIVAMLLLVLGNNLLLLFLGWEGVGLCSYLLIGFWYKDLANARAANKAFVVNRIGDWGLSLGLFLIFAMLVHDNKGMVEGARFLSYDVMLPKLSQSLVLHPDLATLLGILLFIGAAGKSAQFPLYFWLPDAMAGPTPVSALIHAATMVTSGVVLLNRMHIVFENSSTASAIIVIVGAFTALFAAVIAFGQTDIKKVLAFSTVSQLGFMFIGCGAGAYWSGMFHVTTHAFFKALLFLGAGAVIHAMAHNQDMRNYGNLRKYLPITTWTMVIGWLAIAAVALPLGEHVFAFSGAYSKEAILSSAIAYDHADIAGFNLGQVAGWVGLGVALLTAVYMTRLTFLTFFGKEERWRAIPAHEGGHDAAHAETEAVHEETSLNYETNVHIEAPAPAAFEAHPQEQSLPSVHDIAPTPDVLADPHGFYLQNEPEADAHDEHHHELDVNHTPREVPPSMWLPLVILAVLSAGGGYLMNQNDAFKNWLYPQGLPVLNNLPEAHVPNLALYSALAAIAGVILGVFFYGKGLPKDQSWDVSKWAWWRKSAHDQFGYDSALTVTAVEGGGDLARGIWRYIDVGLVDGIVNGSGVLATWFGRALKVAQSGYVRMYALVMLLGGVGFLGYLLYMINHMGGAR